VSATVDFVAIGLDMRPADRSAAMKERSLKTQGKSFPDAAAMARIAADDGLARLSGRADFRINSPILAIDNHG
jgi:hypothetical protein